MLPAVAYPLIALAVAHLVVALVPELQAPSWSLIALSVGQMTWAGALEPVRLAPLVVALVALTWVLRRLA